MRAKFPEQRDQSPLQQGFAAARELQGISPCNQPIGRGCCSLGSLQPEKIEKRKTDAQVGLCSELEGRRKLGKEKLVGTRGNFIFVADAAASITEQEPPDDGNSRRANGREIGGYGCAS